MERGQAGVMYDRYNTRNSLLASTALDWTRFSNHQKMVLPCNGLMQGRASILVTLAPYDSVTGTGDILPLKPVHQSSRERVP